MIAAGDTTSRNLADIFSAHYFAMRGAVRNLAERLSRGRALKRHLPGSVGGLSLFVSPDAQLKYLRPGHQAFDPFLLSIAHQHIRADSIVWDIGANVGVFAFAAAGIATRGAVAAVEPDPWLVQLLRRSCCLSENRGRSIRVIPAAISDHDGLVELLISRRGRASNHINGVVGSTQTGGVRERITVPTLTLDTLLAELPRPTFLKIDVEGAELLVLRGATRLLREARPMILVEVTGEQAEEATGIFSSCGYRLADAKSGSKISRCAWDTLAIPE